MNIEEVSKRPYIFKENHEASLVKKMKHQGKIHDLFFEDQYLTTVYGIDWHVITKIADLLNAAWNAGFLSGQRQAVSN